MSTMLRAVIYCRVSTEEQAESGTSLETQEAACRKKANELDALVVEVFRDEGVSGALYLTRPRFQAALRAIEHGDANTLIVYKLDRSGRDVDVIRAIRNRVEAAGARMVFADGMNFESNAIGKLAFNTLAGFAEFEREIIRERTMAGKQQLAKGGVMPQRTKAPYGYHIITKADVLRGEYPGQKDGEYVIVEAEAQWVREIFARYSRGISGYNICRYLHEIAAPTPNGTSPWRQSAINFILRNPVYKGEAIFGRTEAKKDETRAQRGLKTVSYQVQTSTDRWLTIQVPAIVDPDVWNHCQARAKDNKKQRGNPKQKYMLSGLLRCPICGNSLAGKRDGNRMQYSSYYCLKHAKSVRVEGTVCNKKRYPATKLEAAVLFALSEVVQHPHRIEAALIAYEKNKLSADAENELKRIIDELNDLSNRERTIAEAQVDALMKGRDPGVYEKMLADLTEKRSVLQRRKMELTPRCSLESPKDSVSKLVNILSQVEKVLYAPDLLPGEKQSILAGIINTITPSDEGVKIALKGSNEQMVLVIDNYDSFTYNLVQYLGELGAEPIVRRNDKISLDEIAELHPERILISPGPCTPNEAGVCVPLIRRFAGEMPIFGVCLGHQSIGAAFGGEVVRNWRIMHGKTSMIQHGNQGVFRGLPDPFEATRYHSLVVRRETLPDCLEITAETEAGEIMGLRHREFAIEGVQFHPESALTRNGKEILANFLAV